MFLFVIFVFSISLLTPTNASAASVSYGPLGYDLYGASHQQLFSVAAQETSPGGIAFNPTGTKMFVLGSATDRVQEYSLSTGFDVSTASFVRNFSVSAQETSPNGITFNPTGTKMFVLGSATDRVQEYSLSTGFDVSTASFVRNFSVSAQETTPHDLRFNSTGTKMFIIGVTSDRVVEYNLGTGFDVSTASFSQNFSVASQDGSSTGLAFNQNGTKMFVVGAASDRVYHYSLTTAFDISTASYIELLEISTEETTPLAIDFNNNGAKMFIMGSTGDDVNEYATAGQNGFEEDDLNDGSVDGKVNASLSGETFKDLDADNILDLGSEVEIGNIPSGLTAVVTLTEGDTVANLSLTGNATSHQNTADVVDITFNFKNAAFTGGNASAVTGATGPASTGYGIDFDDSSFIATSRVSVSNAGGQGTDFSDSPAISGDGNHIAFISYAPNLVSGDTNSFPDVFVRNIQTNTTTRVSVATGGTQSLGNVSNMSISGDGRYVTFSSDADNLVAGDANGLFDIFVHDINTTTTTRVSVDSDGVESNGTSEYPAISDDGRYVTFYSEATNLVADDNNVIGDSFLHDTQTGETIRISMHENGGESNGQSYYSALSEDGRYITFESYGQLVAEDANFNSDIYLLDTQLNILKLVSKDSSNNAANGQSNQPAITDSGRYVTYLSSANNLVANDANGQYDVFIYDTQTDTTTIVSLSSDEDQSNGFSYSGPASNDGRFVAFASDATNLVPDDTNIASDIFLRDVLKGNTYRISTSTNLAQGNDSSYAAYPFVMSGDAKKIAYVSYATNLVSNDTNTANDIFLGNVGIYDLTYSAGPNGSVSGDTPQAVIHGDDGTTVTATADSGYHFVDWSDGSTDNPRTDLNVLENKSVTANFTSDTVDQPETPDPETDNDSDGDTSSGSDSTTPGPDTVLNHTTASSTEDADSIPNDIEDAAPNNGDANNDGIKDSQQNNVASFVNKVTGEYVALEASEGCVVQSAFISNETENDNTDESAAYPLGLMSFTIKCTRSGQTSNIKQYYYTEDTEAAGLVMRKYSQETNKYTTLTNAAIDALTIDNKSVIKTSYDVTDGGGLDEDGLKNSVIVDPSGLAREKVDEAIAVKKEQEARSNSYLIYTLAAVGITIFIYLYRRNKKTKKKTDQ